MGRALVKKTFVFHAVRFQLNLVLLQRALKLSSKGRALASALELIGRMHVGDGLKPG
jgi:hypothetical protein